jgi:hypothetical protein
LVLYIVFHKSGYIKPIREAFDFVERYFRKMFIAENKNFCSTYIESLEAAKLICELENSSVRLDSFSLKMKQKLFFI